VPLLKIHLPPVKQDIFLSDVTTCFNSLKKAFQPLPSASDEQLQMAQPSLKYVHWHPNRSILINAREGALTLVADPAATFAMEFDALVAVRKIFSARARINIAVKDWDEYLNVGGA
jgi:meiotic recombination protein REC8, fungi type